MEGLTETLAKEVDPAWNIKVSLVRGTSHDTNLTSRYSQVTVITLGAFRTNAVATGMVKLPPHPAYGNSASAASRRAILASLTDKMDPAFQMTGDTAKAAGV